MKIEDIDDVSNLYLKIIRPEYISYGEIANGMTNGINTFSKNAFRIFDKDLKRDFKNKNKPVFVSDLNGKIVGFVCLNISKTKVGKECWILDLGVNKKYRKLGIAKQLLSEAYKFGNKEKVKYFLLESGVNNHSAHELFKKQGFKPLNTVFIK
jgi:ribosomal protein S18 acetylase RimI-like enzyme